MLVWSGSCLWEAPYDLPLSATSLLPGTMPLSLLCPPAPSLIHPSSSATPPQDEECLRPGEATDLTFLEKLEDTVKHHPHFLT